MTVTDVLHGRKERDSRPGRTRPERRRWGLTAGLVLLGGLLLFLHGCHGDDEDHELFDGWKDLRPILMQQK
jgi:hypothetical protein